MSHAYVIFIGGTLRVHAQTGVPFCFAVTKGNVDRNILICWKQIHTVYT